MMCCNAVIVLARARLRAHREREAVLELPRVPRELQAAHWEAERQIPNDQSRDQSRDDSGPSTSRTSPAEEEQEQRRRDDKKSESGESEGNPDTIGPVAASNFVEPMQMVKRQRSLDMYLRKRAKVSSQSDLEDFLPALASSQDEISDRHHLGQKAPLTKCNSNAAVCSHQAVYKVTSHPCQDQLKDIYDDVLAFVEHNGLRNAIEKSFNACSFSNLHTFQANLKAHGLGPDKLKPLGDFIAAKGGPELTSCLIKNYLKI